MIIFSNFPLNAAVLAWILAQIFKFIITLAVTKKAKVERFWGPGGMPSAHSATVCALCIAISRQSGYSSTEFALSFVLAAIVMYDAMGVRRAAGEQAKVLNKLLLVNKSFKVLSIKKRKLEDPKLALQQTEHKELKEIIGHTPIEVMAGAILGILFGMMLPMA